MGEYAKYAGGEVKIGTCENMYYLRADQRSMVSPLDDNIDPVKDRLEIRFRFPFPDEDNVEPGAFQDFDRSVTVNLPETFWHDFEHRGLSLSAPQGYVASIPCPESGVELKGVKVHRNAFAGNVRVVQQKFDKDGRLVLVIECAGCGNRFRLPTLEDAQPVIDAARAKGGEFWEQVAGRIEAGYAGGKQ